MYFRDHSGIYQDAIFILIIGLFAISKLPMVVDNIYSNTGGGEKE